MKLRSTLAAAIAVTAALAACDSGSAEPLPPSDLSTPVATVTLVPTTSSSPTTVAESTTSAATTTIATAPPTATVPVGSPMLLPDGPWTLVDSAPGITSVGLVYELMPKLWVFLPTQEDRPNGYFWTFNELDRPVIEGYIKALLTTYRATDSVPAVFDDEGWNLYFTPENAVTIKAGYQATSDRGEYTDLDLGVVLRPTVIEDNRTEDYTVLLDCALDGAVARNADGTYAVGATPGVIENGYAAGMVRVDGVWKLAQFSLTDAACS